MPSFPPEGLAAFLEPRADRLGIIISRLEGVGLEPKLLSMAGSRNVLIRYPAKAYSGRRVKCLSAHYDRQPGTPGANDNSAACFQLLDLAIALRDYPGAHDCMIAFTDNEELSGRRRSSSQGSFAIAEGFRRAGLPEPWVFTFDCTGRGSVPILSSSPLTPPAPSRTGGRQPDYAGEGRGTGAFERRLLPLQRFAATILEERFPAGWLHLPTPYSDNLGYLTGGLAAVAITLLPREEASAYARALAASPVLEHILLRKEFRTPEGERLLAEAMPPTWRMIHGTADSLESLDEGAFRAMDMVLDAIASARTPHPGSRRGVERH